MKVFTVRLNTETDHYKEELGPPLPTRELACRLAPIHTCRCLVSLPPYYCWCNKGFWDPDECMEHAMREHMNETN